MALSPVALDQFGIALSNQPDVTWQVTASPSGSNPKLTADGSSVLFEPNLAGKYTLRAQSGQIFADLPVTVTQTLTNLSLVKSDGTPASADSPLMVDKTSGLLKVIALDQFGRNMTTLPRITWATPMAPANGTTTVKLTGTNVELTFNRIGDYTVTATFGTVTASASVKVTPTLTSFAISRDGKVVSGASNATVVNGKAMTLTAVARDQFGQNLINQPEQTWSVAATTQVSQPSLETVDGRTTITFTATGSYTARVSAGTVSTPVSVSVTPVVTRIELTPSSFSLTQSASKQLSAQALDQFGSPMSAQPSFKWTATGGSVSSKGLYVAGTLAGNFSVTATSGTVSASATVEVTGSVTPTGLNDPNLNSLVSTLYVDQNIDRSEMIQILRSVGSDGNVNSTELADLQLIVSAKTPFVMPSHVRSLASDVVGQNSANQQFQGQSLGNLAAGSTASQLNKLVDKWFLGADEPQIATSGLTYQTAVGNLFNGVPSRADTRQGMLGDCYFIAAIASIADRNPDAVRNMFIDNGDGTYTVRFFSSGSSGYTADYVTVNRRLPAYSNGQLGYSGFGQSISQTSTTLWIALAEKAYAQWNETGLSGRDGTNRYSAIEGGWMWYVNAQVLGADSTYAYFSSSAKSTLVNALSASQAVTLGTWPNASTGGLYGSHAYIVSGYNATTDTFTLHNPWGVSHPAPLTWTQLQSNCSIFVYTATTATNATPRSASVAPRLKPLTANNSGTGADVTLTATIEFNSVEANGDVSAPIELSIGKRTTGQRSTSRHVSPAPLSLAVLSRGESIAVALPDQLLDLSFASYEDWQFETL